VDGLIWFRSSRLASGALTQQKDVSYPSLSPTAESLNGLFLFHRFF